jgi:hypothetical protein
MTSSPAPWNLSWTPPAWSAVSPGRDCGLFAGYAAAYMTRGFDDLPWSVVAAYMASVLPAGFAPTPTPFQLLEWHEWLRVSGDVPGSRYTEGMPKAQFSCRNNFFRNVTRDAFAANGSCMAKLCGLLEGRLDEDLAGVGVSLILYTTGQHALQTCLPL